MVDYNKLLEMWREEKQKRQFAEGELSIIKGIGNNSPEMKSSKLEINKLNEANKRLVEENSNFEIISKSHKEINGDLQKKLSAADLRIKELEVKLKNQLKEYRNKGYI